MHIMSTTSLVMIYNIIVNALCCQLIITIIVFLSEGCYGLSISSLSLLSYYFNFKGLYLLLDKQPIFLCSVLQASFK